jgi:hypothetical protein
VIKGINGDDQEKTLTIELLDATLRNTAMTITGTGVGILALRPVVQPPGSTAKRVQAELYVERMQIKMNGLNLIPKGMRRLCAAGDIFAE